MANPRLLVGFTSAAVVVVAAFAAAIAVGEWWILPAAVAVHIIGFTAVMLFAGARIAEDRDKPDPVTEARLEEEAADVGGLFLERQRAAQERAARVWPLTLSCVRVRTS